MNRNHIHAIPVLWPNPRLQKEIAERLSAYDGLIENCERRIRVLDEMAREVYREWFMNFRYPGHEKVPLVDSTIGRIPKEWAFKPIGEVYDGLFDGPHLTPPPASEGAVFLGIGNLSEDGRLDLSSCRYIGEDDLARWTKRVTPQPGDIVFTYEASLHRYAIIPNGFYGCLGRRLALVRTKAERKIGRYLFMSMLSDRWRDVVTRNVLSGSTVDRVPLTRFPEFQILIATTEIIERFDDIVEPLMRDQEVINRAAINLRNTRDLLLPRLLSGQLSVSDVAA